MKIFFATLWLFVVGHIEAAESIVAELPWDAGNKEYKVVVTELRGSEVPARAISFNSISGNEGNPIVFKTADTFISAFTFRDVSGCLMSLWTSGSSYRLWVFSSEGNRVVRVLDVGSKAAPSFIAKQECPNIQILIDGRLVEYEWKQKSYSKVDL